MLNHVITREFAWFYPWLRSMSGALMAFERRCHTLEPTALANEVLAKLLTWRGELSEDTEKSLRVLAVTVAKQTLIDHGRRYASRRKYMSFLRGEFREHTANTHPASIQTRLAAILDAIDELASIDEPMAGLIRLRFFEGYTHQQAAEILGLSPRTAARRWAFAKAFLADAISRADSDDDAERDKTSEGIHSPFG